MRVGIRIGVIFWVNGSLLITVEIFTLLSLLDVYFGGESKSRFSLSSIVWFLV